MHERAPQRDEQLPIELAISGVRQSSYRVNGGAQHLLALAVCQEFLELSRQLRVCGAKPVLLVERLAPGAFLGQQHLRQRTPCVEHRGRRLECGIRFEPSL